MIFNFSGLLVSYLGLKRLETKGKLPLWKFYLHRYIRYLPITHLYLKSQL